MPKTMDERFWEKVDVRDDDECWPWTAASQPEGYGNFWNGEYHEGAHRVSYKLEYGDLDEGQLVRHTCDNPSCVNPNHLVAGNHEDNAADREERNPRDVSGENHPRSALTETQVKEIKSRLDEETEVELAEEYGVARSTISHISLGLNWGED